ncbi:MAG: hypothetical protein EBZ77_11350, partial [Chitinophagia bacterium]|nr:hypothetical protein [Chitinophagia bacterium]
MVRRTIVILTLHMQVVTLFSDFSERDIQVAVLRGRLVTALPHARLIDLAHQLHFKDLWTSAYVLANASLTFPADTIHLVFSSEPTPGAGYVALRLRQQWYVVPDNGLLPFAFGEQITKANHLPDSGPQPLRLLFPKLVKAVLQIATGNKLAGMPYKPLRSAPRVTTPRVTENRIDCNILMADNYGNLLINLK